MTALTATWHPITHLPSLPRSSQALSILHSSLHLFSGSLAPDVAASGELHILPLNPAIPIAITVLASAAGPPPRTGAASVVVNDTLYVFGGRSNPQDPSALEEGGRVWSFAAGGHAWMALDPEDEGAPFPAGRSDHGMAGAGGKVYVHGGDPCQRDLWCFDVSAKRWERLADAPGDGERGSGIAVTGGREIWSVTGPSTEGNVGVVVDVYDIPGNTWRTITFSNGPTAYLVFSLVPIRLARTGAEYLVTLFGEHSPLALGPNGAVFSDSVWAYEIESAEWSEVKISGARKPDPRCRFSTVAVGGADGQGIVLQGGLGEGAKTLGDWWLLEFD